MFLAYATVGCIVLMIYRRLPTGEGGRRASGGGLDRSRRTVIRLAALFSIDSLGGGFTVQSILIFWLHQRFDISTRSVGTLFAITGLLAALSSLLAERIARRIGLVRTMAYTHLPASALLIGAAVAPRASIAIACLILRSAAAQMDVPARTSYVMAVVDPGERAAAASFTNVPRSLATAGPPAVAGWMLDHSSFGWPLIVGGSLKIIYDLLLLALFRNQRPPEELDS